MEMNFCLFLPRRSRSETVKILTTFDPGDPAGFRWRETRLSIEWHLDREVNSYILLCKSHRAVKR